MANDGSLDPAATWRFTMIPYRHELAFERLVKTGPSIERTMLRIYTGDEISELEAKRIWQRIADHKWYVSERLSRDIGFHVAAVDYVENFYRTEPSRSPKAKAASAARRIWTRFNQVLESYFTAKGDTIAL